jgi:mannose/fructose-specific phosphotransferase system component IIA
MSLPVLGVVVGHGSVADALISAAEEISGVRGALVAVTNTGADRDALERRVVAAVGDRQAVVFVDLPSGSCLFAAMRGLQNRDHVRVVTGVNLVMLLDFLFHRESDLTQVAHRAAEAGARAISER